MKCDSCAAAYINGVFCHEHGCPDKWKTETRICKECGWGFKPENRFDIYCPSCKEGDEED